MTTVLSPSCFSFRIKQFFEENFGFPKNPDIMGKTGVISKIGIIKYIKFHLESSGRATSKNVYRTLKLM